MRRYGLLLAGWLVVLTGAARADPLTPPAGRLVEDVWEVAHLDGARVGYFHTTVHERGQGDARVLRTAMTMELTVKRYNALVRLRAETGTEETADGKVTAVFMRLPQDKGELVMDGRVEGGKLHVKVDGGRIDKYVPWNDEVMGLYRQERLYRDRKIKDGDTFVYQSYEPTITSVVTVRGQAGPEEEVATPQGKRKLLRVTATPDKVTVPGASVQLPTMVVWLDAERVPVRRQVELPGMGQVISQRTTREAALAQGGPVARLTDIGEKTMIGLNRAIPQAHQAKSVLFRVTVKGDADASTALARDARQQVANVKGDSFDLLVRAVREPARSRAGSAGGAGPGEEFLKNCYFLNSEDGRVRELAARAVGDETEPLRKARRIERWVHDNMRHDNGVAFAPAGVVARDLAGDCRQHAMLTAALCRAAGVPARTAVGLVYALDGQRRPAMVFHMWAEVWVDGGWLAIDATLGQGSVGAAHVKIADHSWHDTQSLTPMLPVARVLGRLGMEVVRVNED